MTARADLETLDEAIEVLDSDHVASALSCDTGHEGRQAVAESRGQPINLDGRAGQDHRTIGRSPTSARSTLRGRGG